MKTPLEFSELAHILKSHTHSDRLAFWEEIPLNDRGHVLLALSHHYQEELLSLLPVKKIVEALHFLDPDESTDLLQAVNSGKKKKIIEDLSVDIKTKVEFLLRFDAETAAGMMNLDYVLVEKNTSFKEVALALRHHEQKTGRSATILAVEKGVLIGEIRSYSLILREADEPIAEYIKKIPSIAYDADQKEVEALFWKNVHSKVVVLDENNSILGLIFADDILKLINRRKNKELYDFAGVNEEEEVNDTALSKVRHRYKWLLINLGTAFLAASVVGMFKDTISAYVLLAVYMPIVAGMGGNAGTQTMAVTVRGLALRKIALQNGIYLIWNEIAAGAINGLINGVIVGIIAYFWNHSPILGLVLGLAMVINLIVAGFFGALVPLVMQKLGKDPATSATIFITTATDVFGFLVFLSLAKALL